MFSKSDLKIRKDHQDYLTSIWQALAIVFVKNKYKLIEMDMFQTSLFSTLQEDLEVHL